MSLLNWVPSLDFKQTVNFTAKWYKSFQNDSANIHEFTRNQILSILISQKDKNIRCEKQY